MKLFNNLIAAILPYFPRFIIKPFAMPYVAGESLEKAVKRVLELNAAGYAVTMDILGEHVNSEEEAQAVTDAYCLLLETIHAEKIDGTISFKLTHVGLELGREMAEKNAMQITDKARELELGVTIDMENSPYTDTTLDIFRQCFERYKGVGTVLQAYLYRSPQDLAALAGLDLRVRICKGIYREAPEIAIQDRDEINGNFSRLIKSLANGAGYGEIATHDIGLIDELEIWLAENNIAKSEYEFQVLHGVPMGNRLEQLQAAGHKVRIYVPFGEAWFDYAVRRLKENPNMAGYILGNMFKR